MKPLILAPPPTWLDPYQPAEEKRATSTDVFRALGLLYNRTYTADEVQRSYRDAFELYADARNRAYLGLPPRGET